MTSNACPPSTQSPSRRSAIGCPLCSGRICAASRGRSSASTGPATCPNASPRPASTSPPAGHLPTVAVYETFASPGKILTQIAEMPDGRDYFWVSRTRAPRYPLRPARQDVRDRPGL